MDTIVLDDLRRVLENALDLVPCRCDEACERCEASEDEFHTCPDGLSLHLPCWWYSDNMRFECQIAEPLQRILAPQRP